MRYIQIIISFLFISYGCDSNLNDHDKFDQIRNFCGQFNGDTSDLAIVNYFDQDRQLSLDEVAIKVIDTNNNEEFPAITSSRGCFAVNIQQTKKVVIKSKVSNIGAAQPRENLTPGINRIDLVPLTNDMFELMESCGQIPENRDRLLIFKAIYQGNKNLSAYTIDEANHKVDFLVNDYNCVFIDNPPDSILNIQDSDGNFGQYTISNKINPNTVNFVLLRHPLSKKEICESNLAMKWNASSCVKKSFSELYALSNNTVEALKLFTGSDDETSLKNALITAKEINISGSGVNDLYLLSDERIRPSKIDLRENCIKDLSPLSHNENLKTLYATDNHLAMIHTVPKNLKDFGAARNRLRNIEGLSEALQLESLTLKNNLIRDLNPISKALKLEQLYLDNNLIESIDVLGKLKNLNRLWISSNPIKDFTPLSGLTKLTKLRMQKVGIISLEPLASLTKMQVLNLTGNPGIIDISPLSEMQDLHTLWLWGSKKIENLEIICSLKNLKELRLNDMNLDNLEFLAELSLLKDLEAEDNQISSLQPISHLNLDTIKLKGNPIDSDERLYLDDTKCPINNEGAVGLYCRSKRRRLDD
ncbi:MAG: leucine-rich repeat domain-containing protein [Oligoflexales bacterium]|nr:leucine-rich repeat domain-containing protein [Oligoflexales bacterium]